MKKLVSLLVIILLLVNSCVVVTASEVCKISSNDANTKAGEAFTLDINITDNKNLMALSLAVEFDSSLIKLESIENGSVFSDDSLSTSSNSDNSYKLNWVDLSLSGTSYNGKLATLKFKVADDSLSCTTLIKLSVEQAFDSDMNDVVIDTQDVNVTIEGGNKKIKGITLTPPDKAKYKLNENADFTGMKVKALYSDNSSSDVTENVSVTGFDSSKSGTKLVVVSYKGFSTAFKIDIESSEKTFYLKSGEIKAVAGDIVEVPVEIMNNPGITGIETEISFDKDLFSIYDVANGNVFEGSYMTVGGNNSTCPYKILWNNSKARNNYSKNGKLGTIEIAVNENAKVGAYPIKLNIRNVVDCDLNEVNAVDNEVLVNVYSRKYLFGDANGDGRINVKDASIIQKYIAGGNATIDKEAGDCEADGIISILDATKIQKYTVELIEDENFGTYVYI